MQGPHEELRNCYAPRVLYYNMQKIRQQSNDGFVDEELCAKDRPTSAIKVWVVLYGVMMFSLLEV